jgi:RNA polymerase sigma factor (sigma-70 family)
VEVSALKPAALAGPKSPGPLLRLQSDERLIALTRRGQQAAFEVLFSRYHARLLAFCRHMLGSKEDAEDVLQEVFAAAFNAILADEREINVRPWLYRIARNRSLNHLRKASAIGVDSMDVHYAEHGMSTGEQVLRRESFRQLIGDVQKLPETQRSALLLREIDALSYEQIAQAMETTVPSVKSLLVRARISLAEAAEARQLSCAEVRAQLGEAAEGLIKIEAPARRHLRDCERCRAFRQHLKDNNRALAAIAPLGPLLLLKKLVLGKFGSSAGGAHVAGAGGATATVGASAASAGAGGGVGLGGIATAGAGAMATKAAATLAAAALVTAGAVEAGHVTVHSHHHGARVASASDRAPAVRAQMAVALPAVARSTPQPVSAGRTFAAASAGAIAAHHARRHRVKHVAQPPVTATDEASIPAATTSGQPLAKPKLGATPAGGAPAPATAPVTQVTTETTQLPTSSSTSVTTTSSAGQPPTTTTSAPPSGTTTTTSEAPAPSPPASPSTGGTEARSEGPSASGGDSSTPPPDSADTNQGTVPQTRSTIATTVTTGTP